MQGSTEASTSQAVADAASDKINDVLPAFNKWRHAVARLTGLSFTQTTDVTAQETQLDTEKLRKQQKKECLRCQQWRDTVISESPIVRFMLQHVNSLPKPDYREVPESFLQPESTIADSPVPIVCTPCGPDRGGGFAPDLGIILCQDGVFSKKHVEDTLAHELIHEWDHRRFDVDWNNMRMLACSEIRAASLSGDCRWARELKRRNYAFTKQHQECTKRRAVLSVMQHPSMTTSSDEERQARRTQASSLVNEVWESCWNDTRPFDEIY